MNPITLSAYSLAVAQLLKLANRDVGGSLAAAQVLLSAYNGYDYQLDITDLCTLDDAHYQAALAVIRGRVELRVEPQETMENGNAQFEKLWERWKRYHVSNRHKPVCSHCMGNGETHDDEGEPEICFMCEGTGMNEAA